MQAGMQGDVQEGQHHSMEPAAGNSHGQEQSMSGGSHSRSHSNSCSYSYSYTSSYSRSSGTGSRTTGSSSYSIRSPDNATADDANSAWCRAPMAGDPSAQPPQPGYGPQLAFAAAAASQGSAAPAAGAFPQPVPAVQQPNSSFVHVMPGQLNLQAVEGNAVGAHASMPIWPSLQPAQPSSPVAHNTAQTLQAAAAGQDLVQQARPSSSPAALMSIPFGQRIIPQNPLSIARAAGSPPEVNPSSAVCTELNSGNAAALLAPELGNSAVCPDPVAPAHSSDQAQPVTETRVSAAAAGPAGPAAASLPGTTAAVAPCQASPAAPDSPATDPAVLKSSQLVLQITAEHPLILVGSDHQGTDDQPSSHSPPQLPAEAPVEPPSLLSAPPQDDANAAIGAFSPRAAASPIADAISAASTPAAVNPTSPLVAEATSVENQAAVHAACGEQQQQQDQAGRDDTSSSSPHSTNTPQAIAEAGLAANCIAAADEHDAQADAPAPNTSIASEGPLASSHPAETPAAAAKKRRHTKGLKRRASSASLCLEAAQLSQADPAISQGGADTAQVQAGQGLSQSSLADAGQPRQTGSKSKRRRFVVKSADAAQPIEEEPASAPQQLKPAGCVQQGGKVVVGLPLGEAVKDASAQEVSRGPEAAVLGATSQASVQLSEYSASAFVLCCIMAVWLHKLALLSCFE